MPGRQIMKVLFFESSAYGQKRETEEVNMSIPYHRGLDGIIR
jgi:hypothetical protein